MNYSKDEIAAIMATKAPQHLRSLIRIPKDSISLRYSSLTDYCDAVLGYTKEAMNLVDSTIQMYHLGAVRKIMGDHYGTVLPTINRRGEIVGGSVQYINSDDGQLLLQEKLVDHLYNWYCFDYYVDNEVFFGEHLLSSRPVAIVQEEKTAILGKMAENSLDWLAIGHDKNITDAMAKKLRGRKVVMFSDEMSNNFWQEQFGGLFIINGSFISRNIDDYLIDRIKNNLKNVVQPKSIPVPVSHGNITKSGIPVVKSKETVKSEYPWHGRNEHCHKCEHSHEGINGTFCNKLNEYVEYKVWSEGNSFCPLSNKK